MTLDELLIGVGIKADTSEAKKADAALDGIRGSAVHAEKATSNFGQKFSSVLKNMAVLGVAAFAAIKGVLVGAMASFDSTIRNYEALYNSKDKDLRITKEQYLMAKKYSEGMDKSKKMLLGLREKIAFAFLPTMLEMTNSFNRFLDANKDLISNGITKFLGALTTVASVITNTIRFIERLVTSTIGWEKALYLLAIGLAVVKRGMIAAFITNPVAWLVAAIVGLILLIDDFMTFLDGGESEFGEFWGAMIDGIEKVKPYIDAIQGWFVNVFNAALPIVKAVFGYLFEQIKTLYEIFSQYFAFISALWNGNTEGAITAFKGIMSGVSKLVSSMISAFLSMLPKILDVFIYLHSAVISVVSGMFKALVNLAMVFMSGILNAFSVLFEIITQPFVAAFNHVSALLSSALGEIQAFFSSMLSFVLSIFSSIQSGISSFVGSALSSIQGFVSSIGSIFSGVFSMITAPFGQAFDWIMNKFGQLPGLLSNIVSTATFGLSDKIGGVVSNITNNAKNTTINGGAVNATFNVSSNNPASAAKQTSSMLQGVNSMAVKNLSSGIKL